MKNLLKKFYRRLPIINEIRRLDALSIELQKMRREIQINNMIQINSALRDELNHESKYRDARRLNRHEFQVFSQNGEDGVIAEIFRRIEMRSKFFVEIGTGNGLENNTTFLLSQGWRGCWVEGDPMCGQEIRAQFKKPLSTGDLKLETRLVTAENIDVVFSDIGVPIEFDLLSLDIDRNTYYVWKALSRFKPRVVVIEYNSSFPPDVDWKVEYDAKRAWNYTSYMGASLKAYEKLGDMLGYVLVGCEMCGTNAFFVRKDQKLDLFAAPFTSENHYERPRYWSARREGHPPCFDDN